MSGSFYANKRFSKKAFRIYSCIKAHCKHYIVLIYPLDISGNSLQEFRKEYIYVNDCISDINLAQ